MPPPQCARCRQCTAGEGDLWCLACTAWEALGRELCGNWDLPGVRVIANDLVVNTARQVRSLRSVGAGLSASVERADLAGSGRARSAASHERDVPRHLDREDHRDELPRRRPTPPSGPPPRRPKEERADTEEEETDEGEEEEEATYDPLSSPRS